MSKWTNEYREQMKEKVRSVIVRKPNASKYELAKILSIDPNTALKLKKKVITENTSRISEQKVQEEIGKLEAEYEQLAFECWQLITQDTRKVKVDKFIDGQKQEVDEQVLISASEKLNAIKTIIETRKNLFSIKFDSGLFSRKLGELELGKGLNEDEQNLINRVISLNYGKDPDHDTTRPSTTDKQD